MRFIIHHTTHYTYSGGVVLNPQVLRFRPRCDGVQRVDAFTLHMRPRPLLMSSCLDLDGNHVEQAWFEGETKELWLHGEMEVVTSRTNPFDYLLDAGAVNLPPVRGNQPQQFEAYLAPATQDAEFLAWVDNIRTHAQGKTQSFLDALNATIHEGIKREIREHGGPQSPPETLQRGVGACRDLTVLFIEACRVVGIPARFCSGYQRGDVRKPHRHLHAWPEVYLPGGGWRGYDPTHGTAVADEHVAIAAAALAEHAAPVSGSFGGQAAATLASDVQIWVESGT